MADDWDLDQDFDDYYGQPDPVVNPVSPGTPGDTTNTGVGPETIVILIVCGSAPFILIFAVVFGKRCYRRLKRSREVSHRKDDLEGVDNPCLDVEEHAPGLVRSVGGSVVIVSGTIRRSPITGRHNKAKKRCYDQDSIDYGEECQSAFPDDILAEIDEAHSNIKSNGIEVQIEDKVKASSLSDGSSYAHDPRIRSQLNGYLSNGHIPQNGVKCTAISTIAEVLKDTLAMNSNNNTDLSIRDCEIIIHAICDNELKVKQKVIQDDCPLRRLAPERMTMPSGPISFPRRKSSSPSIRSLKGSKNSESWLHSAYMMTRTRPIKTERSG